MKEQFRQLKYKNSKIGYFLYGSGKRLLICFQGYGEESNQFKILYPYLAERYTILSIAFPFHDGTIWGESLDLLPEDWASVIREIIGAVSTEKQYTYNNLSLAAFSMGGRIGFHLLGEKLLPFSEAVLIAPDGLRVNPWYYLATKTKVGNALFKYTMANPGWVFLIMNPIEKMGLLPSILLKFAKRYLENEEERKLLYLRWTTMRRFIADKNKIKKVCTEEGTNLTLIFGKYDPIILKKRSAALRNISNIRIEEMEASHQLIKEKYAANLAAYFSE